MEGEILLVLLCTAGLLLLLGLGYGRLLRGRGLPGVSLVLPARGSGEGLEQAVRSLLWLRSLGLLRGTILMADVGLDPQGRELALQLTARWTDVVLWPADHLGEYMKFYQ